ncbi:MAG TPA: CocE/NonD family hydrolase, partial [Citricoccus sp.]
RLMENLKVPRKALIGPWGHTYPHLGVPGPAIGFLQEVVRWWDHWLKGKNTGLMDEPMMRVWMQDSVSPAASYEDRPGRWVSEDQWPAPGIEERSYVLTGHHLEEGPAREPEREVELQSPLSVGMFAGKWASYAAVPDLPFDQREEDGGALFYESAPLEEDLEVFGLPQCSFEVSADKPVAMLAVRLSDVGLNGEATRVTYGILNLTHRDGSENPQPLEPGRTYRVTIPLNGVAQSFPAGHRLRLSVSTSYWPLVWPSPEAATVTLTTGSSQLLLPVRPPREEDDQLRPFGEPETAEPLEITETDTGEHHWRVTRDLATNVSVLEVANDQGAFVIEETGSHIRRATHEWYSFRWNDVNSVRGETRTLRQIRRGDWGAEVTTRTVLTSTPTEFQIDAQLDAYELDEQRGNPRVYSQNWHRAIPRDLV